MDALRLALWQTPHPADSAQALTRLQTVARDAAAQGAHWLITPEMFLTGYLIDPALIAARAEPVDGPLIAAVRAIALRLGIGLVTGWPEANPGALPYNSAAAIDASGTVLVRRPPSSGRIPAFTYSVSTLIRSACATCWRISADGLRSPRSIWLR